MIMRMISTIIDSVLTKLSFFGKEQLIDCDNDLV